MPGLMASFLICPNAESLIHTGFQAIRPCLIVDHPYAVRTKAEAVELIYELVKVGVLNNGNASIMQLTRWFEQEFQIELVNVPKIFQDIRNRRKETTSLALKMYKALRQYIEQPDEEEFEKNNRSKMA